MGNSTSISTETKSISSSTSLQSLKGSIVVCGVLASPNTQRVLVVLAEKGLKYEFKAINFMESEHRSRQYLDGMQPFGLFPVLIDEDGFKVYVNKGDVVDVLYYCKLILESRAICRYLEEKYKGKGTELIPTKDIKARFLFEQAVNIEAFNFEPYASGMVKERLIKKFLGRGEPDEAKIAELKAELAGKLNAYEKILSKQPYMAGQVYTMADLFHVPFGALLFKMGEGDVIESRPHVKKWWDKISSRSAWKAVEKII